MQFKENYKCILSRKLKHKCWFKVALYMNGSTFYEPTSQHGNLDILSNCFYWNDLLYNNIA